MKKIWRNRVSRAGWIPTFIKGNEARSLASRPALVWTGLLLLLAAEIAGAAEVSARRGRIQGASHVNVRSGPDVIHPSVAILREGEEVGIEGREGSWYRVSLPDETEGYVHVTLISPGGPAEKAEPVASAPSVAAADVDPQARVERRETLAPRETIGPAEPVEPVKPVESLEPVVPGGSAESEEVQERSEPSSASVEDDPVAVQESFYLSLAQVVKQRNWEMVTWFVGALCIFVLGWILGGNYYRRRDRIKRTRLEF